MNDCQDFLLTRMTEKLEYNSFVQNATRTVSSIHFGEIIRVTRPSDFATQKRQARKHFGER